MTILSEMPPLWQICLFTITNYGLCIVSEVGCMMSVDGVDYLGAQNVTVTGHSCLEWRKVKHSTAYGEVSYDKVGGY